jgi:hypothetical protein
MIAHYRRTSNSLCYAGVITYTRYYGRIAAENTLFTLILYIVAISSYTYSEYMYIYIQYTPQWGTGTAICRLRLLAVGLPCGTVADCILTVIDQLVVG